MKKLLSFVIMCCVPFAFMAQYNWTVYTSSVANKTFNKVAYFEKYQNGAILTSGYTPHTYSNRRITPSHSYPTYNDNYQPKTYTAISTFQTSGIDFILGNPNFADDRSWVCGNVFIGGNPNAIYPHGQLLKSVGTSTAFTAIHTQNYVQYYDINFGKNTFNTEFGAAVGFSIEPDVYASNPVNQARISYTADQGTNWTNYNWTNPNGRSLLRAVKVCGTNTAYAVGVKNNGVVQNNGTTTGGVSFILKTIDGGVSWSESEITTNNLPLNNLFFINENTGWVVGDDGTIHKTINGGTTWTQQVSTTTQKLNSIYFFDTNNGWAVGNTGTILKTINGGTTWEIATCPITSNLMAVDLIALNNGVVQAIDGTILKLTPCTPSTKSITASSCNSYTLNNQTYTTSGVYTQTLSNSVNCDSIITLNLTIKNASQKTITEVACGSYQLNGQTYITSGTYVQTLTNKAGCDSTVTINLTINQPNTFAFSHSSCDSYTWNNQTYTASGTYTQVLKNSKNCDSTVTLTLVIKQPSNSSITEIKCSNSYTLNNQIYTSSGTYTQHLTNKKGCDSTITLNLTLKSPTSSTLTISNCGSYSLNGQMYTSSGTYTQNMQNAAGCDSTITLHLTILASSSSTLTVQECTNYNLNNTIYSTSGTYMQVIPNSIGCDSTITLHLTILSNSSVVTTAACESYTLNNETYTTSGTYTQILVNKVNCDSIVTLNLTIDNLPSNLITTTGATLMAQQTNATYQWIDCGNGNLEITGATAQNFTPIVSGNYAVEITKGLCVNNSVCTQITISTTGIDEKKNPTFKMFPNPAKTVVTIDNASIGTNLQIVDITGKKVLETEINTTDLNLNISFLNDGVYFVHLMNSTSIIGTKKLVISK